MPLLVVQLYPETLEFSRDLQSSYDLAGRLRISECFLATVMNVLLGGCIFNQSSWDKCTAANREVSLLFLLHGVHRQHTASWSHLTRAISIAGKFALIPLAPTSPLHSTEGRGSKQVRGGMGLDICCHGDGGCWDGVGHGLSSLLLQLSSQGQATGAAEWGSS